MSEWIDLTQPMTEDVATHPAGHPMPEFKDFATYDEDKFNSTMLHLETHCGTHMDSPAHMYPKADHRTIDEITPDEMVSEGIIVDLTNTGFSEEITEEDLIDALEGEGIRPDDYVILDTGTPPERTDDYLHEYPYLSIEAAEYIAEQGAGCVATPCSGVDKGGVSIEDHTAHLTLLPETLIIEGVANLSVVDAGRYDVIATPIPYANRDGSQIRLLVRPQ